MLKANNLDYDKLIPMSTKTKKLKPKKHTKPKTTLAKTTITNVKDIEDSNLSREQILELLAKAQQVIKDKDLALKDKDLALKTKDKVLKAKDKVIYK